VKSVSSPCTGRCMLIDGTCNGCHRTLDEIKNWRNMSEHDRMAVMERLNKNVSRCGSCGAPNKCAMEAGKSVSVCWCFTLEHNHVGEISDTCLCKSCLTLNEEKG